MQTYNWNPWSIFDELERTLWSANRSSSEWPTFDIEDDEDATTLSADLPGLTDDDIEISVIGQTLVVRGERKAKNTTFVRRDRWYGAFERQFRLDDGYDLDDVRASIAHGVLTIRLTKTAKLKPRRIKLTTSVVDKVKGLLSGGKDKEQNAA
jgi:HSP20 family molecular chaperone IbpA